MKEIWRRLWTLGDPLYWQVATGVLFACWFLMLLSMCSCGGGVTGEGPRLAPGKLTADAYLSDTRGDCGWLGTERHQYVDIDAQGGVASPLSGVIDCTTTYAEGSITVRCGGLGAQLDLSGTVEGPQNATLSGHASGNVGGCEYVAISMTLSPWRP
jgi:hypothetical protein